jgi:hypothetical protein
LLAHRFIKRSYTCATVPSPAKQSQNIPGAPTLTASALTAIESNALALDRSSLPAQAKDLGGASEVTSEASLSIITGLDGPDDNRDGNRSSSTSEIGSAVSEQERMMAASTPVAAPSDFFNVMLSSLGNQRNELKASATYTPNVAYTYIFTVCVIAMCVNGECFNVP